MIKIRQQLLNVGSAIKCKNVMISNFINTNKLHGGSRANGLRSKMNKNMVYVYNGEGASDTSKTHLIQSLEDTLTKKYSVSFITPEEIIEGSWTKKAAVLAFGGGYDLGFINALGREGVKRIKMYVADGGKYLGICAGGYFGCNYIEFDKDGPLEVCGERHLSFFPGLCKGPAYPGFKYNTMEGSLAVSINFNLNSKDKVSLDTFFHGGGYFILSDFKRKLDEEDKCMSSEVKKQNYSKTHINGFINEDKNISTEMNSHKIICHEVSFVEQVQVLAKYSDLPGEPTAIVKTKFGHGTTILTGVHVEFIPALLLQESKITMVIKKLEKSESRRLECFKDLLQQLKLDTI